MERGFYGFTFSKLGQTIESSNENCLGFLAGFHFPVSTSFSCNQHTSQCESQGKPKKIKMPVQIKIRIHINSRFRIMAGSRERFKVHNFSSEHSVVTD